MHEMISARHPFHGPSHYDTLRNMVTKPPTIDQRLSAQAAAVVRSFLVKNPKSRLCCKEGIKELQRLAYFSTGIDWDDLFNRRKPMPYIPRLHDSTDISSFEATFTNETPVDSVADAGNSSQVGGKKKGFFGGLFGGNNTGTTDAADKIDNDSFKGFSFTKDDSVLSDPEAGKARTAAMAIPRTSDMTESNKSGSAGEGAASPVGREVADSSGSYVPPPPPEPSQDSLSSQ